MRKSGPILILVIGILALIIDFVPGISVPDAEGTRVLETKVGLDLQGGLRVEYQALPVGDKAPRPEDLEVIRTIIENRVNSTGVAEPVITTQGSDRIVVELPGVSDPNAIRNLVGQTGRLDFVPLGTTQKNTGDTIDRGPVPTAVQWDGAVVCDDRDQRDRQPGRQLRAQGHRREAVRRLHGEATSASSSRSSSTARSSRRR